LIEEDESLVHVLEMCVSNVFHDCLRELRVSEEPDCLRKAVGPDGLRKALVSVPCEPDCLRKAVRPDGLRKALVSVPCEPDGLQGLRVSGELDWLWKAVIVSCSPGLRKAVRPDRLRKTLVYLPCDRLWKAVVSEEPEQPRWNPDILDEVAVVQYSMDEDLVASREEELRNKVEVQYHLDTIDEEEEEPVV
jgi:hypothetical protein